MTISDTPSALSEAAAWMYESPFGTEICRFRWGTDEGLTSDHWLGWTETPLYRTGQLVPVPSVEALAAILAESDPEFDPEWDYVPQADAVIAAIKGEPKQ